MEEKKRDEFKIVNGFRRWSMAIAEAVDSMRLAPRSLVIGYGVLVSYLVVWFVRLETYTKTECDNELLLALIDKGVDIEQAKVMACTVAEVVGGPTTNQTAFVTIIIGLSTAIFGLYSKGGRDWAEKPYQPWQRFMTHIKGE